MSCKICLYTIIVLGLVISSCESSPENQAIDYSSNTETLFQLLDPANSHIDFINEVVDGENFNILTYRNFYNGGGVSIGDINNDGFADIFFTANAGKNKLYLNKGGLTFEDISESAGVTGTEFWSTGSAMVDINNDGWLDIYVCNSGDVKGNDKENELFINNGNLTFTNQAQEYNLNNKGFSTHASFFDYDLDGDLDCYILNNSFKQTTTIELYRVARESVDDQGGDKLYRNDGGIFTDVTVDAGIYSSKIGFGLGVSVSDVNGDMLPDIYVSNDFWERDYLYINQGNGTFSEELNEHLSICSMSSMGADIADLNNDGKPDIFTTDMLAADNYRLKAATIFDQYHVEDMKYRANYHYQMLQNCLHLNRGDLEFQEIGSLTGISATDWSWGALMFDFENDGQNDIYVSNGIAKDILYLDFSDFIADKANIRKIVVENGRVDWRDFLPHLPSNKIENYAFSNRGQLQFENLSSELGLGQPSFSNGAAYADLDNDGDMDLVVNNVNMTAFVYENRSNEKTNNHFIKVRFEGTEQNRYGIGSKVEAFANGKVWSLQNFTSRGFESSIEPVLTIGLGSITSLDSMVVTWPDLLSQTIKSVQIDTTIKVKHDNATKAYISPSSNSNPLFKKVEPSNLGLTSAQHQENEYNDFDNEQLLLRMLSTEGPGLVIGDVNGDNLDDLMLLGARGDEDKLFLQQSNGKFKRSIQEVFDLDRDYESTCGVLIDLENDGDLDLVLGSGGNEPARSKETSALRVYYNNGNGQFSESKKLEDISGNLSTIEAADFNEDGYQDLFVGARAVAGNYGLIPKSYLLQNQRGELKAINSEIYSKLGMVTDAVSTDYDADGDLDLMIVGDWMPVTIMINQSGFPDTPKTVKNSSGWWNAIHAADLDGDGDDDFVLGNWGLNSKFKASTEKPLTMYVKDYDGNGKSEFVINWYPPLDDISYPFATKKEITQQLPLLKKSILKHEDYAHKTYETLFTEGQRAGALAYRAETLANSILRNNDGQLALEELPVMAQVSPVFAISTADFNGDGLMDIWMGGNFYNLKPQVGRSNSSKGIHLQQQTGNQFNVLNPGMTGMDLGGEVRDVQLIRVGKSNVMIIALNNDQIQIYEPILTKTSYRKNL